ncbi:MAG TPA: MerR family transcriptional regulator [Brumimicrobium sp.]|nr:MerR family transcriptional regulator [Brumimicrobium sp.]
MGNLRYSIKDLENFTQIKAHTIRIWEQRYGLLEPKRTSSNIRYYNQDDLKKLLNINLLYNSGFKISKIAALTDAEIIEEAKAKILITNEEKQSEIDALILLILGFKGNKIKETLEQHLKTHTLDEMYMTIILPLLDKIGQLWQVDTFNIIHEHYFSTIFRELVFAKIAEIKTGEDPSKTALLFLHDNEEHEFSLLIFHYILKKKGYICHNFGQKVPMEEVLLAHKQIKPQVVVTTFTAKLSEKKFEKIEKVLVKIAKTAKVMVSGFQIDNLENPISKSLHHVRTIDELSRLTD